MNETKESSMQEQTTNAQLAPIAYAYSTDGLDGNWTDDSLYRVIADNELVAGSEIFRGVLNRPDPSSFLPDKDDILNHMANQAYDGHSEWCDNYPDVNEAAEAELLIALEPLKAWAEKHCGVNFYTVEKIEQYTVTREDVEATADRIQSPELAG